MMFLVMIWILVKINRVMIFFLVVLFVLIRIVFF